MTEKKESQSRPVLGTNRLLKNAFFKKIYEHEEYLLDAASLLANRKLSYTELANVEPILFGGKENDLAFLVDGVFYFMIEAQSSWNPNMPFRILVYIATALLSLVAEDQLYGKKLVNIKVPKLYTVFTGLVAEIPEQVVGEQRLSDAYIEMERYPDLEVIVHTYHFNMRKDEVEHFLNAGILPDRLQEFEGNSLLWYSLFSNSVDYYYKVVYKGQPAKISQAVVKLCELFKSRGMFVDLFSKEEVVNVTIQEFSREKELLYAGREEGREEGRIEGSIQMLSEMGLSKWETAQKLINTYHLSTQEANDYVERFY